jgi:hypothetical protein
MFKNRPQPNNIASYSLVEKLLRWAFAGDAKTAPRVEPTISWPPGPLLADNQNADHPALEEEIDQILTPPAEAR